jgi:hypothetical protein
MMHIAAPHRIQSAVINLEVVKPFDVLVCRLLLT